MDRRRAARLPTQILAGSICTFGAPVWIATDVLAGAGLAGPFGGASGAGLVDPLVLIGQPLALSVAVILRAAVTRSTADAAIAGLGAVCGLVAVLAVIDGGGGGVAWGGLFAFLAGVVLALAVLADAVVTRIAVRKAA